MKAKVLYYVILTIQVFDTLRMNNVKPKMVKRPLFYPTDVEDNNYDGIKSVSRKYCGRLSFEQLVEFLNECNFTSTCQTMGALTMEYGFLDAVSFEASGEDYYDGSSYSLNAYISPIYDDEFYEGFGDVPEDRKPEVWAHMKKCLDWLQNDALDELYDIKYKDVEAPAYLNEVYFDIQQLLIPNFS